MVWPNPIGNAVSSYARLASASSMKMWRGRFRILSRTVRLVMPCSRRRCTSRSRVRAEVMPMPDRRRSVIDAFQPAPDCGQGRVTGEVDLQRRHRDVSLGDGVEVGTRTRVLLRAGGTDPVHRTPARVLRPHDRLGTVAIAEPAG